MSGGVRESSLGPKYDRAVKTVKWVLSFTIVWCLYGLCRYEKRPISEALSLGEGVYAKCMNLLTSHFLDSVFTLHHLKCS